MSNLSQDSTLSKADDSAEKAIGELLADPEFEAAPPPYSAQDRISGLFPPSWNLYHAKSHLRSTDYHIGVHQDQPLFNVNFGGAWNLKTGLTLTRRDDPDLLAEVKSEKVMTTQSVAIIPSANLECPLACSWNLKTSTYSFVIPIPQANGESYPEKFEWRVTFGQEVKRMDKWREGWKLVRLGRETVPSNEKLKRADRPLGMTSDSREVVAVWAANASWSLKKYGKFRFMGSGATGELGKTWAIMCVASICRIFQTESGEE